MNGRAAPTHASAPAPCAKCLREIPKLIQAFDPPELNDDRKRGQARPWLASFYCDHNRKRAGVSIVEVNFVGDSIFRWVIIGPFDSVEHARAAVASMNAATANRRAKIDAPNTLH